MHLPWGIYALLFLFIGPIFAAGGAGVTYATIGIEAATHNWWINCAILMPLTAISAPIWHLQKVSVKFSVLANLMRSAGLFSLLVFSTLPIFFITPPFGTHGILLLIAFAAALTANGALANKYYKEQRAAVSMSKLSSSIKGKRISIRKINNLLQLDELPSMLQPRNGNVRIALAITLIGFMLLGLNFRKTLPVASVFMWGLPALFLASWFSQPFVIAYHQLRLINGFEKERGHPLLAAESA
jgi:hypothetical protein